MDRSCEAVVEHTNVNRTGNARKQSFRFAEACRQDGLNGRHKASAICTATKNAAPVRRGRLTGPLGRVIVDGGPDQTHFGA
jgi:hypothetical protein